MGGEVKHIEIKIELMVFTTTINLKNFESNLLNIDKKHYKSIDIYYIVYITIKKNDDCKSIYSVNSLYLLVNHANG